MKTELIADTWGALGETQHEFVEAFYGRFFARFPIYRPLFPKQLNAEHLEKMVQTMKRACRRILKYGEGWMTCCRAQHPEELGEPRVARLGPGDRAGDPARRVAKRHGGS